MPMSMHKFTSISREEQSVDLGSISQSTVEMTLLRIFGEFGPEMALRITLMNVSHARILWDALRNVAGFGFTI